MNCSIFEKRLEDLIEDNISFDLKDAMFEHMEKCPACKKAYEEKLSIDESFKKAFNVTSDNFQSSRSEIMKNIDRNRYSKSPAKKLYFYFKRNRIIYTSCAALLAFAVFITPYFFGMKKEALMKQSASSTENAAPKADMFAAQEPSSPAPQSKMKTLSPENNATGNSADASMNRSVNFTSSYIPRFEKSALNMKGESSFATPWVNSPGERYSAEVTGRGADSNEEGIASLLIKDLAAGSIWQYKLIDNKEQYTPKQVYWVDDNNILVIVGFGYGTVSTGGGLYLMNIETAKAVNADSAGIINVEPNGNEEISKVLSVDISNKDNSSIKVQSTIFDTADKNKSHIEEKIIPFPYDELKKLVEENGQ